LDTAEASSASAIQAIPPWISGYFIPKSLHIIDLNTNASPYKASHAL